MVFGWLINLLKSIFGFGSKDAGTLENKESESEIRKAKLRIEEDKERLKQAKTEKKERGNERKEVKEIGEILGGENLGDDLRKIKELIAQDEKILRELRQDEIEASRIEAIGIRIEREDQEEIRDESQIGAGQSPRAAGDQQAPGPSSHRAGPAPGGHQRRPLYPPPGPSCPGCASLYPDQHHHP